MALVACVAVTPALVFPAAASAQGSFTNIAEPTIAVLGAARLTDGRVLSAQAAVNFPSAPPCLPLCFELYEPASDRWVSLVAPQRSDIFVSGLQEITALPDGTAFIRYHTRGAPEPPKYRFDPKAAAGSQFTQVKSEFWRSTGSTATLLDHPGCRQRPRPAGFSYPCGQVLVQGGGNESNQRNPPHDDDLYWTAELYDPATNLMTPTGSVEQKPGGVDRFGHFGGTATLLDDGRVLAISGGFRPRADMYDPFTGAWTLLPDPPDGPYLIGWAVRLPDGRVLTSGNPGDDNVIRTTVVYDPAAPPATPWATAPPCPGGRSECRAAAVLPDGTVLVAGASSFESGSIPKAAVLTPTAAPPAQWRWTAVPGLTMVPAAAVMLEGGPGQCGAACGSLLLAGSNAALVKGGAQLFQVAQITGLLPTSGFACGGQQVTITGSGFQGASVVNFGDSAVRRADAADPAGFTVNEAGTQIVVAAPPHAPGPVRVTVSGSTALNTNAVFTYLPLGPATVSSLSNKTGPAAGKTPVQITGQFPAQCVRAVTFGAGRPAELQGPASDTLLNVISPPGTAGETVQVAVEIDPGPPATRPLSSVPTTPGAADFTYRSLPVIGGINPGGVSALGGTARLSGTGFERYPQDSAGPQVTIGGQSAEVTGGDATGLTVTVPPMKEGRDVGGGVPVVVTTEGRGVSAPFTSFAYHPGVAAINPPKGTLGQDTAVTLTGLGLDGVGEVLLGGAAFPVTSFTPRVNGQLERVTFTVPPREVPEEVPVQVRAAGLISLETVLFTYGGLLLTGGDTDVRDPTIPRNPTTNVEQPVLPPTTGGAPVQAQAPVQAPAPGSAPAPVAVAAPVAAQAPAPVQLPGFAQAPGLGQALAPGQAPVIAQAPGIAAPAAPAGPAAAAAQGTTGGGQGPGQQGATGREDDESPAERPSTRYAMNRASSSSGPVGLGAALMTGCFSLLMLRRRASAGRSRAGRARPRGAY